MRESRVEARQMARGVSLSDAIGYALAFSMGVGLLRAIHEPEDRNSNDR